MVKHRLGRQKYNERNEVFTNQLRYLLQYFQMMLLEVNFGQLPKETEGCIHFLPTHTHFPMEIEGRRNRNLGKWILVSITTLARKGGSKANGAPEYFSLVLNSSPEKSTSFWIALISETRGTSISKFAPIVSLEMRMGNAFAVIPTKPTN